MKIGKRIILLSLICSTFLYANDGEKMTNLESITVTANKIEENLKDVPQSITVIDDEILKQKGIKDIEGVISEVPNMNFIPDHGYRVNFRGLNSSLFTNNNPVVIYIDGVPTTGSFEFNASMINVERIEVLRGPQGTLYGKDAIGGVINIVTKEASNEFIGNVGLEYGSYNYMNFDFNTRGALIKDKLFAGLNGEYSQDDGWITNDYKNDDKAAKAKNRNISAFLEYRVTDRLKTKLVINNEYKKDYWNTGYGISGNNVNISDFSRNKAENTNFDMPAHEERKINSQSILINYEFDNFSLDSITTHKTLDLKSTFDSDFGISPMMMGLSQFDDSENKSYTQELRLSNSSEQLKWIAGLYADMEEYKKGPYGMQFPNFDPATYTFLGNFEMDAHSKTDTKTYAAFAQAIIPFGDFELTLGGRYQKIKKEMDLDLYYLPLGTTGSAMYSLKSEDANKDWNKFLPKVALTYKLTPDTTTYASVSKGYMPGGFNYFATSGSVEDNSFKPQQSTNYEIGIKTEVQNFNFAASIFRMDIKDIHVYKSVSQGIYLTDNAKKAHSQGLEFQMNYYPTNNIEVTSSFGFIDAKYDDYDAGAVKFDGQKIEQTPSSTANIGVLYTHPSGFYTRADLKYAGGMHFYDDVNKAFPKVSSRTIANLKLGYRINDFDLYAYVTNLTDEEYINTFKSSSIVSVATFGEPRKFGLGLRYRF